MPSRRAAFILALLVLMEMLAGFTVVVGSSILDATPLHYSMFWWLLICGLAGLGAGLAISGAQLQHPWNRVALLATWALVVAVCTLLTSRTWVSALATALLLAVAYWRGLAVTGEPPSHGEVQRRFGLGFAILFFGIAWVVARGIIFQRPVWTMLAMVGIAYTVAAMAALSAARVEQTREPGAGSAVVMAVGAQLAVLVILGLVAVEFFALDIGGWLAHLTQPFWNLVGIALRDVLMVLVAPMAWLIENVHPHARPPNAIHPLRPVFTNGNGRKLKAHPVDSPWVAVVGAGFLLLLLAGIGLLVWRTLPRLQQRRREPEYREERRPLWSLSTLWQMVLVWLHGLVRRGARAAGQAAAGARRRVLGPVYPEDPVRRLYARLLRRAETGGMGRRLQETPTEFERRLAGQWPEGTADFGQLTSAYVRRRYGDIVFDEEEVAALGPPWQRIRKLMRASHDIDRPGGGSGKG